MATDKNDHEPPDVIWTDYLPDEGKVIAHDNQFRPVHVRSTTGDLQSHQRAVRSWLEEYIGECESTNHRYIGGKIRQNCWVWVRSSKSSPKVQGGTP